MVKKKTSKHAHHTKSKAHAEHRAHKVTHKDTKSVSQDSTVKNIAIIVLLIALVSVIVWAFNNADTDMLSDAGSMNKGSVSGNGAVQAAQGDFNIPEEVKVQMNQLIDDDPMLGAQGAPVTIVEFSDFECPYCSRFALDTFEQIKETFIETGVVRFVYRDLPLSFHANAQKAAEAAQCAHDQEAFWEYHDALFANQKALTVSSLKKYAADLGLDTTEFNNCLDSGKHAAEVQADAQAAAQQGISGTPGFVINGQKVSGAQPFDKFEQVICSLVPESQPCKDIPPPVEFTSIVINDQRCTSCATAGITARTSELFPGAKYEYLDASDAKAQDLIEKYDLTYAPAYIFPEKVTETATWQSEPSVANFFIKLADGSYRLRDDAVGASWFLSEEKRAAYEAELASALGMTKGDNKPQVDFFVMSYCPYGNQAEELLKPIFDQLKDQADFIPRYVIYNQGTGCYTDTDGTQLCSLHGEVELNQNIRELCVLNDYGQQEWFDFALAMNSQCNSNNADTCWTEVADGLGLDTDMISSCFDENKLVYAREQYELSRMLGVTGSPTLFFEGQQYNGARTANSYLAALCAGFDDAPAACEGVVAEPVQAAAPSGSC